MLQDCINIFAKCSDIDKMILDTYTPAEGTYLIMEESHDGFKQKELIEIKQDRKTKAVNITEDEKRRISYYDYYCKLLDMNKPIDKKKIIQSNNYLSFWVKKESLSNGKLTNEIIDAYYEILSNPYKKYSKSKDKELYAVVEKAVGDVNQERLQIIKSWIKDNIFKLPFEIKGKDYLKIFFVCSGASFEKEGSRYILPNIFNKNEYNEKINDKIYGLPNENFSLDNKKPYLKNNIRLQSVPTLVDINQIMIRKKFFDYLWNLASSGKSNIYFNNQTNRINPFDYKTSPTSDFRGYYLRIRKDKNEAAILDMDMITSFKPGLKKPVLYIDLFGNDYKKLEGHGYGYITTLYELRDIVNREFFFDKLATNFFTEPGDLSIDDGVLKESVLLARSTLFNWFYKGYESGVSELVDKVSLKLIRNSIANNELLKAQHQFNLRVALLIYFKGGCINMADVMKEIRDTLRDKLNSRDYNSISSDHEYYYAVGQLIRFFISKSKSNEKKHSLFNPFLNMKRDNALKEKIASLFKKYNYDIEEDSFRFNNLYKLVISYVPKGDVNQDYMIAGYISNNLIYEKKGAN